MDNNQELENKRHSLAHLLASSVLEKFPDAKLGVGPVIDNGFYYDFVFSSPITDKDLAGLEKRMKELAKSNLDFQRQEISTSEAKEFFEKQNQPFKIELISNIEQFGTTEAGANSGEGLNEVSLYKTGEFTDLCRGGHVENTSAIDPDSFKLDKLAGAYWRGDEKNPQMTRIYGLAFNSGEELNNYLAMREEAEKRDHKKLGPQMDLFVFSDLVGAGLPLFTPKGTLVRDLLDSYVWSLRKAAGYQRVDIPHVTKKELYETSGHWEKFKDELFRITTREGHEFAMKPMNCPHHTQIYNRKKWSYRQLPQRYSNTTKVYRDEQTGELSGLSRVRGFTQDDAHVFCRSSQVKEELKKVWEIVEQFYASFGFALKVRLSLHDPKNQEAYLGKHEDWLLAEESLRELAGEMKTEAVEGIGEAAFYGPKLDFIAKDSLGREWQIATIQLDFNQPERFDLTCVSESGEEERVSMIHAAIMGSIERFLSLLIEHTAGNFPVWLAPTQVAILPISDKFTDYAVGVRDTLLNQDPELRLEIDGSAESIGKKIRNATSEKNPYMLILGQKELDSNSVAVRKRDGTDLGTMAITEFAALLNEEIANKA